MMMMMVMMVMMMMMMMMKSYNAQISMAVHAHRAGGKKGAGRMCFLFAFQSVLKRWVFNFFRKDTSDSVCLRLIGREFQSSGAALVKAL